MNSLIVEFPRPACKPHSVSESNAFTRRPSLWARRYRLALAAYPEPECPKAPGDEPPPPAQRADSCLALLRAGVAWPRRLPVAPVSSYLAFSPSRQPPEGDQRTVSLWPDPEAWQTQ